jgi:hypothetical protein
MTPPDRHTAILFGIIAVLLLCIGLAACATGPNEKPRWKAYSLEVKE